MGEQDALRHEASKAVVGGGVLPKRALRGCSVNRRPREALRSGWRAIRCKDGCSWRGLLPLNDRPRATSATLGFQTVLAPRGRSRFARSEITCLAGAFGFLSSHRSWNCPLSPVSNPIALIRISSTFGVVRIQPPPMKRRAHCPSASGLLDRFCLCARRSRDLRGKSVGEASGGERY